eukprot:14348849-Ditylum_brightwellii.AAC.1
MCIHMNHPDSKLTGRNCFEDPSYAYVMVMSEEEHTYNSPPKSGTHQCNTITVLTMTIPLITPTFAGW